MSWVSPASTALACSVAGPLFCLKTSPALLLRINALCLASRVPVGAGFYWCTLTAWLDFVLCVGLLSVHCASCYSEWSLPIGWCSSCLHSGTRRSLLFMVTAVSPLALEKAGSAFIFFFLSTPTICRTVYREEGAWDVRVKGKKKIPFPTQGEHWVNRAGFPVRQNCSSPLFPPWQPL